MTTNIGLVTSDAVVLGCDSIASASTHYLNPFAMKWERDSAGNIVKDANGKWSVKFDYDDLKCRHGRLGRRAEIISNPS